MKTLLLSLVTGIAAFAAGWLLKPDRPAAAGEKKAGAGAVRDSGAAKTVNPFRDAMTSSAPPGPGQIEPFRSAEEILVLMEEMLTGDELAQIELFAALPRLMVTDVPVIKAMLDQLSRLKAGNREARGLAVALLAARWVVQEPENATGYLLAHGADFAKEGAPQPGTFPVIDDEDMREGLTMFGILLSAKRNPAAAQALTRLLPEEEAGELKKMLDQMEATADPANFLTTSTPEKLEKIDDITPLLARWARNDPAAAAKWAEVHKEAVDGDGVNAIAVAWARKDRAAAMAWASGREEQAERYNAMVKIAGEAVEGLDQSGAETELSGFPAEVADTVRMDRLNDKGGGSADFLKAMAVKYAGDEEMSGRVAGHTSAAVREFMARENGGAQAAAWIASLPDGEPRASASVHLIDDWANRDPEAASAWVKALPAGDTRERATGQLVEEISREDPAGAIEWAKTLTGEDSRREKMREVFESWLPKEPDQAMIALQTLPEAERTALFKSAE